MMNRLKSSPQKNRNKTPSSLYFKPENTLLWQEHWQKKKKKAEQLFTAQVWLDIGQVINSGPSQSQMTAKTGENVRFMHSDIYLRFRVYKVWFIHKEALSHLHNAYVPRKYNLQKRNSKLKDTIVRFRDLKPVFSLFTKFPSHNSLQNRNKL